MSSLNSKWNKLYTHIYKNSTIPVKTSFHFDGLVQDCSNYITNALELLQSYTNPSILLSTCHGDNRLLWSTTWGNSCNGHIWIIQLLFS